MAFRLDVITQSDGTIQWNTFETEDEARSKAKRLGLHGIWIDDNTHIGLHRVDAIDVVEV